MKVRESATLASTGTRSHYLHPAEAAHGDLGQIRADDVRRLLEIAVVDTLGLENSIARSRTLVYIAQVGLRAIEVGELEDRLQAIESTLAPRI